MTIVGDVIHHHKDNLRVGTYARIKNFSVKRNYLGGFKKGDMSYAYINVTEQTCHYYICIITLEFILFYIEICITNLKKTHENIAMATFNAIVVGIRGHYKSVNNEDFCHMVITYGITKNDDDIVEFFCYFQDEYTTIKYALKNVRMC